MNFFRSFGTVKAWMVAVIFVIIVGFVASVILVQQEQDPRQHAQEAPVGQDVPMTPAIPGEVVVKFKEGAVEEVPEGAAVKGDTISEGEVVLGEFKVDYTVQEETSEVPAEEPLNRRIRRVRIRTETRERLERRLERFQSRESRTRFQQRQASAEAEDLAEIAVVAVPVDNGTEAEAITEALKDPEVEYAERNYSLAFFFIPNDPQYFQQYALKKIEAPRAWDITQGNGVKIAIIDSGFSSHQDLVANITITRGSVYTDFVNAMHGTYVAGIAGAVTNNTRGVAGTCPQCKLMLANRKDSSGAASDIIWAADNGAKVISMSFGATPTEYLKDAIKYAYEKNVVLVAAAGNGGPTCGGGAYPAADPLVISVAATTALDQKADFSSCGPNVKVAAPGEKIYSTLPERYGLGSGT
ncbi:MAG: S8 family serine peptidase, partial [Candidatus Levybacteria bacterium]|nr:S8 family serine peptidase [Candidatus Levybacteria bacterium]